MKKKILFISHDAARAGAQILLINLLKWFKENSTMELMVLLGREGELLNEFENVCPVLKLTDVKVQGRLPNWILKIQKRTRRNNILNKIGKFSPDLIYANSVASSSIVSLVAKRINVPIICHVHELEISIKRFCGIDEFKKAQKSISRYIVASKAVQQNLVNNHEVSINDADIVYEYIPVRAFQRELIDQNARNIRVDFGIPDDAIVVGGAGTTDWRKAPDLFIQLAATIFRRYPNEQIYFLWIGGNISSIKNQELQYDIKKLKMDGKIIFAGSHANPLNFFTAFDIFTLTSREDPFPVVCLESAYLKKPIICFENAGGMPEFVTEEIGFTVPYLNINSMAEKVMILVKDHAQRKTLGKNAYDKVTRYHDVDQVGRQIENILVKSF